MPTPFHILGGRDRSHGLSQFGPLAELYKSIKAAFTATGSQAQLCSSVALRIEELKIIYREIE